MVHKWYKYTINKRIIKQSKDKLDKKKNRYNRVYYNGFVIDVISLFIVDYLPMQNVYFPTQTIFILCKSLCINGEFFE